MIIASAPGKVILFGEHSIVYPGHVGVAAAIRTQNSTTATAYQNRHGSEFILQTYGEKNILCEDDFKEIYSHKSDLDLLARRYSDDKNTPLKFVLAKLFAQKGYEPMNLEIKSDFRSGLHLGSGTSVFAAVAATVLAYMSETKRLKRKLISDLAYSGDVIAHGGMPSGIDNTAITYGGFISYEKTEHSKRFSHPKIKKMPALVWDSGEESKTSNMVELVKKKRKANRSKIENYFDEINQIALAGTRYLEYGNIEEAGECMRENHKILKKIGVSTPTLDAMVEFLVRMGVYGAKLTGAGGGGCVVAIGEKGLLEKINSIVRNAYIIMLGAEGVRLE